MKVFVEFEYDIEMFDFIDVGLLLVFVVEEVVV